MVIASCAAFCTYQQGYNITGSAEGLFAMVVMVGVVRVIVILEMVGAVLLLLLLSFL
jgi:hypothetical protein